MSQNIDEMQFCTNCQMNVFSRRPEFKIKMYLIFAIVFLIILLIVTILFFSLFTEIILAIFFMWGFMIFNPYLLYYVAQEKQNCPRCYQKVVEKNLKFYPFGEKTSEIHSLIIPKKDAFKLHCPYCGNSLNKKINFCNSCGKKIEIKW